MANDKNTSEESLIPLWKLFGFDAYEDEEQERQSERLEGGEDGENRKVLQGLLRMYG